MGEEERPSRWGVARINSGRFNPKVADKAIMNNGGEIKHEWTKKRA